MPMYLKLDSVVGEILDTVVLDSTFVRIRFKNYIVYIVS